MPPVGSGSLESLRERNRRQLLDALRRHGSASRADLARHTGLSRSTVSTLIAELQASGMVKEHEPADGRVSQQGRPPTLLTLDRSAGLVLGIDFGHEHVHVAIADLSRTILAERVHELDVDRSAAQALDIAVTLTDEVVEAADVDRDRILSAGVGLSGPIDVAAGTVHAGKILPGWAGVRPVDELAARLSLHVHLDNDANLGALAEGTLGAGIGARDACSNVV
jgi:DNA-binding transcriptional ArsR family regulator